MAVVRTGRIITMTTAGDVFTPRVVAHQIRFVGKNLVAGDLLRITDANNSLITDHYVQQPIEDIPVVGTGVKLMYNGVKIASMPGGLCEVQVHVL